MWAQAAGYAQQELTNGAFSFDGLDGTAAWGQSSTLPAPTYDSELPNIFVSTAVLEIGVELTFVIGYRLDLRWHGPSRRYTREWSLARGYHRDGCYGVRADPRPTVPHRRHGGIDARYIFQPICERATVSCVITRFLTLLKPQDFTNSLSGTPCKSPPPAYKSVVLTQSKALTNVSSVPSPQSDGTGDGFIPFPSFEATSSCVSLRASNQRASLTVVYYWFSCQVPRCRNSTSPGNCSPINLLAHPQHCSWGMAKSLHHSRQISSHWSL